MDSPVRLGDWMYVWISYLKFIVLCYVRAQQFLIVINRRGNEPIYDKIYVVFSYYLLGSLSCLVFMVGLNLQPFEQLH